MSQTEVDQSRSLEPGAPLLGRDREMGRLLAALESAWSGQGRLVLLTGEAGIGKTRLADALAAEARQRGSRVLWGRCWEAGGAPVYWPWVQAIRAYVREGDAATLRRALGAGGGHLARVVPEIRELLPDLPDVAPDDTEGARFRVFEETSRLFRAIAADRPTVLILEDVHAADESSLLLLRFLAGDLADSRLFVLAACRDDELAALDSRSELLADLGRLGVTERVAPRGLSPADVAQYLEVTASVTPPDGLVQAVHRETEGNPLFVGEIVRLLADEGRLREWEGTADRPLAIPEGVRAVIGRRLARLAPACRDLLARASVLGVEIPLDVLGRIEDRPIADLLEVVDEAVVARVIVERNAPGARWRFAHALIRDVLYSSLSASTRIRLHRRIGEALEEMYAADPDPPLAELALHFVNAAPGGDAAKAVEYARRAAERAARLYAYDEAMRLYRLALDLGGVDEPSHCRLLIGLAEATSRAGNQAAARELFLRAADEAERLGLVEDLARAAVGYGGRFVWVRRGDDDRLVPLLERALGALPEQDSPTRVRLLARLAGALRDDADMSQRAALSAEALAMARRLGDPFTLAYALVSRYTAIAGADHLAEMASLYDEIRTAAESSTDPERLADAHWLGLILSMTRNESGEAIRSEIDAYGRIARELRQPSLQWHHSVDLTVIALLEGRLADAEALLDQTRQRGGRTQTFDAEFSHRVGMFTLRREQKRLAEVRELMHRSVSEFPGYPLFRALAIYADAVTGREDAARRALLMHADDDFAFLPRDLGWLFGMTFLAESALRLDLREVTPRLEVLLKPFAGLTALASGEVVAGPVDRVLGLLAVAAGRTDEALDRLEAARRQAERLGSRAWELRIAVERAHLLADRDGEGDRERATELIEWALESSRALGLVDIEIMARQVANLLNREPRRTDAAAVRGEGRPPLEAAFRLEGEYWTVGSGTGFRLRDSKGLRYLHILLGQPGREFLALDLVRQVEPADMPPEAATAHEAAGVGEVRRSLPIEVIDEEARAAYRERLRELSAEMEEAESFNDVERAERARVEIEALKRELSAAFGLGGRARESHSPTERARVSVTKAIRAAMLRIEREDASLAAHLGRSIRTGLYCVYDPDPAAAPRWRT